MKPLHTSNKSEAAAVKKQTVIYVAFGCASKGFKMHILEIQLQQPFPSFALVGGFGSAEVRSK